MIAVVFDRHGGPDVMGLREMPDPEPGHGQVRVRVAGCGVNHLDLWVREGMPGWPPCRTSPAARSAGPSIGSGRGSRGSGRGKVSS